MIRAIERLGFNSTYEYIKLLIEKELVETGANINAKGFKYVVYGVELLITYEDLREQVMNLYNEIAKEYGVRPLNVERCIRYLKKGTKYEKYTTSMFLTIIFLNVKEKILKALHLDMG